ncbi:SulP family inorganic anion transporter [Novosphingobium sp. KCTC 2891]|uniref:SulP family inorganic anion transporter n=1 Tax=Novosphingobium sp. KCTC 2891 TaxID=2989730 RepID=UPI002222A353|nr:SulP family inorganic anion transporter [Novosphingobium sp. KCTC 2891]MCW1383750.1 SulP family inorganic anion transporter [Novosphingobium sp. KCTC 2891]
MTRSADGGDSADTMSKTMGKDLIAGLAVAGVMLPEGVAYAGIAGLAPGRALLAGIAAGLVYALIGRSRFAVIAPTSSSAAMLGAALAGLPGGEALREGMATALVAIVGLIFLIFHLFRLGGLAGFISRPVLRGFAFGLAILIIVRQLPKLLGVTVPAAPIWWQIVGLVQQAGAWHVASTAMGLTALATLLLLRRHPRFPAALIVMCGGTAASILLNLPARGVAVAGPVSIGFSAMTMPDSFAMWSRLVQLAAPIALILFAESWGTMRGLALRHGDMLAANRELGALGAGNLAAALVQGMPVGAGFSAGSANEAAGAASRLAGAAASMALLALALFGGRWIAQIPEPVLAAVVIAALTHALSPGPLVRYFHLHRDQWIAVAAAVGVLSLGVMGGMLGAVALSVAALLYDLSHPTISELGRVGDSHDYVDMARHPDARTTAELALFRPNAPLMFANAESALAVIAHKAIARPARTVILSLEESNDLDGTAIEALGEFAQGLAKAGKRLILARAHDRVRDVLAVAGMTDLARNSTFSVADAAQRAATGD